MIRNEFLLSLSVIHSQALPADNFVDAVVELWEDALQSTVELSVDELVGSRKELSDRVREEIERLRLFSPHARKPAPVLPAEVLNGSRYQGSQVKHIASGGLGDVFQVRDHQLDRDIALKRPQDRWADRCEVLQRLEREALLTARLEHPCIVPTYEFGRDTTGRPYYAMRLVKGRSLTQIINELHSSNLTADSLWGSTLFRSIIQHLISVSNAIAYAHSQGVLHRDLKPDNVQIGSYGETFLMDWGLASEIALSDTPAKYARPLSRGISTETQDGQVIGTPEFISPEQAAGEGNRVGPATDIFGLGATLYAILTGQAPYTGAREIELARSCQFPAPLQVNPTIPQALAAVCSKAMACRPSSRYATAVDFASDLERWLADEPVSCYSEGMLLRVWRWLRHHQVVATSAAVAVLVATVALAWGTWALGGKNAELRSLNSDLTDSRAALEEKTRVSEQRATFLQNANELNMAILNDANLHRPDTRQRSLADAMGERLREMAQSLDEQVTDDPAFRAEQKLVLANSLMSHGHLVDAEQQINEAIDLLESIGLTHETDYINAKLLKSVVLAENRQYDKAITFLNELITSELATLPEDHALLLAAENNLAECLSATGEIKKAIEIQQVLLKKRRAILGDRDPETLTTQYNLASGLLRDGRFEAAISEFQSVLAGSEVAFGADHLFTLQAVQGISTALGEMNRLTDAIPLAVRVYETRRRTLGSDNPETLDAAENLAMMYNHANRHENAVALLEECVTKRTATLGQTHPATLRCRGNLGKVLLKFAPTLDAISVLEPTLAAQKSVLGAESEITLSTAHNLAEAYAAVNRLDDAIGIAEEVAAIRPATLPRHHPWTLATRSNLGRYLLLRARHEDARTVLDEVLAGYQESNSPPPSQMLEVIANCYLQLGKSAEALDILAKSLRAPDSSTPDEIPENLRIRRTIAAIKLQTGHPDEAVVDLANVLSEIKQISGVDATETSTTVKLRIAGLDQCGQPEQATAELLEYAEELRPLAPGRTDVRQILIEVFDMLAHRGRQADAEQYFRETLNQLQAEGSPEYALMLKLRERLIHSAMKARNAESIVAEIDAWLSLAESSNGHTSIPEYSIANLQSAKGEWLLQLGNKVAAKELLRECHIELMNVADDGSVPNRSHYIAVNIRRLMSALTADADQEELAKLRDIMNSLNLPMDGDSR